MSSGRHRPGYFRPRARWYWRWGAASRRCCGVGAVLLVFAVTSLGMDHLTSRPPERAPVVASRLVATASTPGFVVPASAAPIAHFRTHSNHA
jgi:hypothetical protein